METIIEFKNIKKAYGDKVVLEDFNLIVEKGEFVTIIGSSGCGKTTALKMINGLIEPTSGRSDRPEQIQQIQRVLDCGAEADDGQCTHHTKGRQICI